MSKPTDYRDFFISYSSKDLALVGPVVDELKRAGRSFWFDQNDLRPFDSALSERIASGIAHSQLTLAFVSGHYLTSDACKWELLQTLKTAGLDRLLVVALPHLDSLQTPLADNVHHQLPTTASSRAQLIADAEMRLTQLPSEAAVGFSAIWWQDEWHGSSFEGRFDERLRLLSALTSHLGQRSAANRTFDRAQIVGLGGQGKSMLALQFAQDFQTQFRAIARFDAGGDRLSGYVADEQEFLDEMLGQVLSWAAETAQLCGQGVNLPERRSPGAWGRAREAVIEILRALDSRVLWIVDDVPAGLSPGAVQLLLCPGAGKTVLTTRTNDYLEHFPEATIQLTKMDRDEAVYLLVQGDGSTISRDRQILAAIADEVDCHALALAVLARRIGSWSATDVLSRLRGQPAAAIEELERAARRIGGLPGGHGASIVATLGMSIQALEEPTARAILLLATVWPTSQQIPFPLLAEVIGADAIDGAQELVTANLAEKSSDDALKVHALVSGVAEYQLEPTEAVASSAAPTANELRTGAARWLSRHLDKNRVWSASEAGETAWHLLAPIATELDEPDRHVAAESLMAMARLPMRHKPADLAERALVDYLDGPITWARTAEQLSAGNSRSCLLGLGRAQAMQGLLIMDQAEAEPDDTVQVRLARQARGLLEQSVQTRLPLLEDSADAEALDELVRAYFNFGRLITLAKALAKGESREDVGATLDTAEQAYAKALDARKEWLAGQPDHRATPTQHENLASCHRGLAIVAYTRLMYQPNLAVDDRASLLEQAWAELAQSRTHTHAALRARPDVPRGLATADMTKDLALQAKLQIASSALALLPLPEGLAQIEQGLDSLNPALETPAAEELAEKLVPWDAEDPNGASADLPPGLIELAQLRVHESRGGRGESAGRTLADFRNRDLPALVRALSAGESRS